MKIKIYGSRGTIPFFSRENLHYGGNTACVRVDTCGKTIIIDCGTGLAQFQTDLEKEIPKGQGAEFDVLLTHLHLDHIIGFTSFAPMWDEKNNIRIFVTSRDERPLSTQIFGMYKPPYWPVDLEKMNCGKIVEITDKDIFMLDDNIKVTPLAASHQDKTTVFRVDADKSVVYLSDYEINAYSPNLEETVEYCKNADLVIFDSAYLPKDYENKKGWGHSTYEIGMMIAKMSCCKQMVFTHFSQEYSDKTLKALEKEIKSNKFLLAYDGMELLL